MQGQKRYGKLKKHYIYAQFLAEKLRSCPSTHGGPRTPNKNSKKAEHAKKPSNDVAVDIARPAAVALLQTNASASSSAMGNKKGVFLVGANASTNGNGFSFEIGISKSFLAASESFCTSPHSGKVTKSFYLYGCETEDFLLLPTLQT